MSVRTDLSRQRSAGSPATATDIDNPLGRLCAGAINQDVGDRRKHDVLRMLAIGPALAARPVPVCNLVGVLLVAYRWFHHRLIRRAPGFGPLRWRNLRDRLGRVVA